MVANIRVEAGHFQRMTNFAQRPIAGDAKWCALRRQPLQYGFNTRDRLQILDSLDIPKTDREKIDCKNLEAVTGVKLVK